LESWAKIIGNRVHASIPKPISDAWKDPSRLLADSSNGAFNVEDKPEAYFAKLKQRKTIFRAGCKTAEILANILDKAEEGVWERRWMLCLSRGRKLVLR
jgi:hypothetical protein